MEGTQGIHAGATFIAVLTTLWLLWSFISVLLDFPQDTVQGYLFWGSFVFIAFTGMIIVPYLIAMRPDSSASIVSAFMGMGIWGAMIILNLVLFPFFQAMINIFTDINLGNASQILVDTMQDGTMVIQLFSIFYILVVIATLYLLPLFTALNPNIITDRVKKRFDL